MRNLNMFLRLLLWTALAAYRGTPTCDGFNIDVKFPVIKQGKSDGSFFGFSVALHRQTKGSDRYLLLVGAPKEKAVIKNVNETGAVYACPISEDPTDCTRMDLVTSTNPSEIVEDMWLGVTVASQRSLKEGRVLACGHRYVKISSGQRGMIGKCYVRSNDLTFDNTDDWQIDSYERCNPSKDHKQEGLCNLGISGAITETDVVLGATGSYNWKGNVHLSQRDPKPDYYGIVFQKMIEDVKKNNIYIGYSVLEERKLLSRDRDTVVTGSPRDESKGSVMLGEQTQTKIQIIHTILGEQVGSYFGSSLAATDLNNDDWNDLIVGAPFYFDRVALRGGAVYVFMNENGSFQSTCTMMLTGEAFSGFGTAVAAIGDVNQDGFQDFAVGAPFHGTGRLYIWMGSKTGVSQEPSQIIEGKSVNGKFQTFGYSINAGLDMDNNGYPDILVGSLDERVALLRARPVIHLTIDFSAEPKIVDPMNCPAANPCISVIACLSFTLSNGNKDFKKNINIPCEVAADTLYSKKPRVQFQNGVNKFIMTLTQPSSSPVCHVLKLSVEDRVKDKLEPVVFSLNITLPEQDGKARSTEDLFPTKSPEQKLTQKTVINFQKACGLDNKCTSNLQLSAEFAHFNGTLIPRKEFVQVLQFDKSLKRIKLMVVVTNFDSPGKKAEDAHLAMLNVSIPNPIQYSGVRSDNPGVECRSDVTVMCELGNPLEAKEKVSLQLVFETSGIDLYTEAIKVQLMLSTLSEQSDLRPTTAALQIESVIKPSFFPKNFLEKTRFGGSVKGEYAMRNTSDVGSLVEFTLNVDMRDELLGDMGTLAVEFDWPLEVPNGKWLLYLTKIVVKGESEMDCIPAGVINPLNLTLSEGRPRQARSKRQADENDPEEKILLQAIEPQAAITLQSPRKSYVLDCSVGTARCVKFTCPLLNMSRTAEIRVRSRLWNSTMLEDYPNALNVRVKVRATLKLITDKPTIKMDTYDLPLAVDIEPEESVEIPYELPLWIIISAAVAGLLLLGIIILILWKCGFFQRASRREMYEAKAQKAEMKIQPSETEKMIEEH
ncbi:integrin alpha-3b [Gambusia affinis]|uniref:integrin alpha-3b n=1 Tax=Gambusia affinis TaxID=33528 RepID=UPI001CDD6EDB|nr:integrin alpha-3b [Gambusia affinis]XP_043959580.1 integrin alpha-3b [Gambusia affinis]XP_043959581.1 integrin alpha-3b [Gambusia affinis]